MSSTIDLSGNNDLVITSDTIYIGALDSSYAYFNGNTSTNLTVPGNLTLNSGQIYGSSTYGVSVNINPNTNIEFTVTDNSGGSYQFIPTSGNIILYGGSSSSESIVITANENNFLLSSNQNIQMKTGGNTTWLYFYPSNAQIWGHNTSGNANLLLSCDAAQDAYVGINNYNNTSNYLKIIPNSSANTTGINNLVELDAWGSDLALTCQSGGSIYFGSDDQNTSNYPMYLNTSNGNLSAYSFNATSDYRIKSNIEEINSTYIDKLRPVTYTNNKNNNKEFGLIAHELQEHYPELVTGEKDSEKMQSINYIGLIPLLIREIQRLNSLTEKLTNEVEQLKKML